MMEKYQLKEKVTLKKDELIAYLDAKIRDKARWKLKWADEGVDSVVGEPGSLNKIPENVDVVAARVYDSIITSYDWDDTLIKATRAVGKNKFTVSYVASVINKGVKAGVITYMESKIAKTIADKVDFWKGKRLTEKKSKR